MSRQGFKRYSLAVPVLLAFLAQGQQALAEENQTTEVTPAETTVAASAAQPVVAVEEKSVENLANSQQEESSSLSPAPSVATDLASKVQPTSSAPATGSQSLQPVSSTSSSQTAPTTSVSATSAQTTSVSATSAQTTSVSATGSDQRSGQSSANQTTEAEVEEKVKSHSDNALPSDTLSITNVDPELGSFDVLVSNVSEPEKIRKVLVPVWSNVNSQDDLKWYEAKKQDNGDYLVNVLTSNHNGDRGLYHANLYYVKQDGQQTPIAGTTVELKEEDRVKANAPSAIITVANQNDKAGTFDVLISRIVAPKGLRQVSVPIWSDNGGQDDLKWYSANKQVDGSYKVSVNINNHKGNRGLYHAHVYFTQGDGSQTGVGVTQTKVSEVALTGKITIANKNDQAGSFDVVVTNVSSPEGLKRVVVPVWSDNGGQDDIQWYDAKLQSNGSYVVNVRATNHKNSSGNYNVHLYYDLGDGSLKGIAATKTTLNYVRTTKTTGTITIANKNDKTGTFDVVVTNVSSPDGLKRVVVPVWSETSGQDDIRWYDAQLQSNGSYVVNVQATNHKNSSGIYNAHLYYELPDGKMAGIGGTKTVLNYTATSITNQKTRSKVIFIDPGHGGRDPGAYYGGTAEKTLALDVSNMLKRRLEASGYQVVMSRSGDQYVDFVTERSRLANNSNADIFVSIHFNATGAGRTNASGIETYWYQADSAYPSRINQAMHNDAERLSESQSLARAVQTNLVSTTGATNRGVKRNTFAVLRETSKPAILVELGFMDNPTELAKIKQRSYQEKLAEGLAKGILSWYGTVGATAVAAPAPANVSSRTTSVAATTGGTNQLKNLTGQQTRFLDAIYPSVKSASQSSGLLPSVMTAQAILESGWGQSRLASSPNNNLYGIKAGEGWSGTTTAIQTKEFAGGRYIDVTAYFRTYRSWAESIANYATFFTSTPWRTQRYASYRAATNYQTALPALQAAGYATDPQYANKLKSIIERYNLQAWDR